MNSQVLSGLAYLVTSNERFHRESRWQHIHTGFASFIQKNGRVRGDDEKPRNVVVEKVTGKLASMGKDCC